MQNDPSSTNLDPYGPKEIARRVENVGVAKAELAFLPTMMLAILAGAFIALGAAFYTLVITNSGLGFGPARLLGGMAFSLGLILVVVGGAELFTGNNLIVMAWADGKVTHSGLLRNWGIVYVGNFIGALGTAVLVSLSGILGLGDGGVAMTAIGIAESKLALPPSEAFFATFWSAWRFGCASPRAPWSARSSPLFSRSRRSWRSVSSIPSPTCI